MQSLRVTMVFAVLVCGSLLEPDVTASDSSVSRRRPALTDQQVWRTVSHGGINSLYFLLRICGRAEDYESCIAVMTPGRLPQTAADVMTASRKLGYELEARFVSPDDLNTLDLPVIIHLDGDNPSTGYFAVLLQAEMHRMVFLNGSTATIATVDKEAFLRRWSGVVIVPKPGSWRKLVPWSCGLLIGLGVTFSLYRKRNASV